MLTEERKLGYIKCPIKIIKGRKRVKGKKEANNKGNK